MDFAYNITGSRPKRQYFINQRGWLDLLGSIPAFGLFQLSALLRLARLSRLARITRLLRGNARKELVRDMVENRGQYATFITILAAGDRDRAYRASSCSSSRVARPTPTSLPAVTRCGGDWSRSPRSATATSIPSRASAGWSACWSCSAAWGSSARWPASWRVSSCRRRSPKRRRSRRPSAAPAGTDAILGELAELRTEVASLRTALGVPRQDSPNAELSARPGAIALDGRT